MTSRIQSFLIGKDVLAPPTSITYKSSRNHGTALGGCCSLMISCFLFVIVAAEIVSLIVQPQYNQSQSIEYAKPSLIEKETITLDKGVPVIMTY